MDYLSLPLKKRAGLRAKDTCGNFAKYPAAVGGIWTREGSGPLFTPFNGERGMLSAYIEKPSLRFEGNSREICQNGGSRAVTHNGWYVDNSQFETTQGVVYRLPSAKGFVAGASDPWNSKKDGTGPFLLMPDVFDNEISAARAADSFAERYAEFLREDDAKQQAEAQIEDKQEEIASLRNAIRDLVAGIRQSNLAPVVCARLRADIQRLRSESADAWQRIRTLQSNYWESVS